MIEAVILNHEQIDYENFKTIPYTKLFSEEDKIGDILAWAKSIGENKTFKDIYFNDSKKINLSSSDDGVKTKENSYKDMFISIGKEEYLNELKKDKEFNDKYNKWVQWFKNNFTMKTNVDNDNPKNEVFFNKDGKIRMENFYQHEEFWVDYNDIWSKVEGDFEVNYTYISNLIQSMVGEAFKITPFPTNTFKPYFQETVGEAFKITPFPTQDH